MSLAASSSKRRIGGHFGSAVGASTKRQRGAATWREEIDDAAITALPTGAASDVGKSEGVVAAAVEDSDSSEALDPGTPLPSDSEGCEDSDGGHGADSSSAAPTATCAAEAIASLDGADTLAGNDGVGATHRIKPGTGVVAAAASKEEHEQDVKASCVEPPQAPVIVSFELLIGETVHGTLRILLSQGLSVNMGLRLAACGCAPAGIPAGGCSGGFVDASTAGNSHAASSSDSNLVASVASAGLSAGCVTLHSTPIDALVPGCFCSFGGYSPPPKISARPDQMGTEERDVVDASNGFARDRHDCAGLLSVPLAKQLGFVLTLGPQPQLDPSHEVVGRVLAGRAVLRRLEAVAPCSGESQPRLLVAFRAVAAPKIGSGELSILTEIAPASDRKCLPFSRDDEAPSAAEILEVADLELNGRDEELADLKQQAFCRERQEGIAAIEASLGTLTQRLDGLGDLAGQDTTLAAQRSWHQERLNHLLRILKKLR
eukprot:TRINITY_DN74834_c0_g1_i1.p1 TRINITY_DN74834_c0_g1~~TRINITY_DN74834_c0_g1_i1.p1  ORF type:complete len:488 (-),score=93.94 TRINITY_DN74834_c0_g1_i1:164-1627(-)